MPPSDNQVFIRQLLEENQRLLVENNELLHKLHRGTVRAFWFRVTSYAVFIGLPIILYYYLLSPYLGVLKDTYLGTGENTGKPNTLDQLDELDRLLEEYR